MLLREYFSSARRVHQLNTDIGLLEKMSPLLQGNGACACTLALFHSPRLACTAHSPFASHATCAPSFFTSALLPHTTLPLHTVALIANKRWLDHIWFFHGIGETHEGREFIAALANVLVRRAYIANERVPVGYLYILRRGIVVKLWRFLRSAQHASPPPSVPLSHASLFLSSRAAPGRSGGRISYLTCPS